MPSIIHEGFVIQELPDGKILIVSLGATYNKQYAFQLAVAILKSLGFDEEDLPTEPYTNYNKESE